MKLEVYAAFADNLRSVPSAHFWRLTIDCIPRSGNLKSSFSFHGFLHSCAQKHTHTYIYAHNKINIF